MPKFKIQIAADSMTEEIPAEELEGLEGAERNKFIEDWLSEVATIILAIVIAVKLL